MTTRIYRWGRNPQQNLGCFFIIFGTALIVRSLISFILAVIYLIVIHFYIVYMEEKYLEKLFEKEYSIYKQKIPRYIGRPKSNIKLC
ncbi:MAG: methyltransferase family protein [Promethearchaeota archaeon]